MMATAETKSVPLGRIVSTPGALQALQDAKQGMPRDRPSLQKIYNSGHLKRRYLGR